MRKEYDWYIRPSPDEIEQIWTNGLLTVDANVLLDLYRYNASTRESLIWSLEQFRGRVWMSKQAADEFVRNRHGVIISARKSFETARKELEGLRGTLESVVNNLCGNRIVSQGITETLRRSVDESINSAQMEVYQAKNDHPDFLSNDPIFERLLELFDDALGKGLSENDYHTLASEAKRRIDNEIPPGFRDADKEGSRKYGDYFLWKEILDAAREKQKPVVLVTSENKDDWWEEHSGLTVGPRPELLQEFMNFTGQRILIYKTERFLTYAVEATGRSVDESAVEDIVAVSARREGGGPAIEKLEQIVDEADEKISCGKLSVQLLRPVYGFTCSGQLDPTMVDSPRVHVELAQGPDDMPKYKLGAGTGTDFDFNVHIKSTEYGVSLPEGTYTFDYKAQAGAHLVGGDDEAPL